MYINGGSRLECLGSWQNLAEILHESRFVISDLIYRTATVAIAVQFLHSKNEGMKHIPTQYDSHTFSFHTMGMKEAFILL